MGLISEAMKYYAPILAALLMAPAAFAAEQPRSVVELFTSQGCSSCPPANEFVASLAEDEDKLVLSYGVTYWDYLGWKDTFADPKFTQRQRIYGRALGATNIYTPQIVLNGQEHSSRYTRQQVERMRFKDTPPAASLALEEGSLKLASDAPADAKVVLVQYMPGAQSVDVKRGENYGRTLDLANVVTDVTFLDWDGGALATDITCLLYTSPSPRDKRQSRMPSSA